MNNMSEEDNFFEEMIISFQGLKHDINNLISRQDLLK